MKNWDVLIVIFLLSLSTVVMHPALAKEPKSAANASLGMPSNETELISFVESALVHVKDVGKEKAIKDFMDFNGSWVRGDVYIFAHDFNGTTLVLPFQPNAVGTNRLDVQDANGQYINREMNCIALHGSGFYRYMYRNPINNKTQEKVSYVSKVDNNWWLGAGIYYNNSVSVESNFTSKSHNGSLVSGELESNCPMMWKYIRANDAVNENLSIIDQDLERACEELSNVGIQGLEAQAILKRLEHVHPSVIDVGTVDANGTFFEVEPEVYQSIKGVNVAFREDQKKLSASKHPIGFEIIRTIEGFYALEDLSPVFDETGRFVGGAGILLNYTKLFDQILSPMQLGGKSKFWVMRAKDGMTLYETDRSQIGLNLSSPIYRQFPELLNLGKMACQTRTGYGTYSFFDKTHGKVIKKGVYWTTIANQGEEMRLMMTIEQE